ncbi:ABC transporter permease subunit [Anaerosacchariphilus polymeriproducens]|uniref:Sugar ABC transporter permease n=1 Tax=Anaerosacchariphilus polymeriproducens TaxID=1812858 RepID=A0A371AWA1_9FIRM|nr:ABC transporter permease subunit [Anaerosacchariphilus polymeriproducens]RDU23812.1 sugar ABC transporter permease [Anaerosacchariphilus polymeriproducens]
MRVKENSEDDKIYIVQRICTMAALVLLFVPSVNPARICGLIGKNISLFTAGTSYSSLCENFKRAFDKGWVGTLSMQVVFLSSLLICIGIILAGLGVCITLGSLKLKQLGNFITMAGGIISLISCYGLHWAAVDIQGTSKPDKVEPMMPQGIWYFIIFSVLIVFITIVLLIRTPKPEKEEKYSMESKYKLFFMLLPFIILCFVFCYLPLSGWRYAFFNYKAGDVLTGDKFVGFKWFIYLFKNESTRNDLIRVIKNTLAMSGLGLATSWCAMAFAIFLSEIKNVRFRRFVQTFTTIPNFISWVLVYAVAFSIFSTDGFLSSILIKLGILDKGVNFLMSSSHMWLKMLAWGMWKGLGWGAIIYIAAISGIDQQLYEAATVDGAGRFQRMWYITVPSLIPTFMVLLLLAIAGILSNGMDQYLVFENSYNTDYVTVLDLYVYKLGVNSGKIPLATVIGMAKSLISVVLLFSANSISKVIRKESII